MATPHLDHVKPLNIPFSSREQYEERLFSGQERLLHIQQALYHAGERAIIVFEGTDAAGKGGAIRRATQLLDPRGFRVHAIGAPSPTERKHHYLRRFFQKLPPSGRIAIFDRSWYGRVLVERVEGLASIDEWQRAYDEIREFERWLTDDGIRLIKFYLSIDRDEQRNRFEERLSNPRKYWKLTEEDIRNRRQWDAYTDAVNDLFRHTHTATAPWHLVDGRYKWQTRVHIIETLVDRLGRGIDIEPPGIDPAVLRAAKDELGLRLADVLPLREPPTPKTD